MQKSHEVDIVDADWGSYKADSPMTKSQESTDSETNIYAPKYICRRALPEDPFDAVSFTFLAEGAANAVFQIQPSVALVGDRFTFVNGDGEIQDPARFFNKVLRISKGKPKTLTYDEVMTGFEDHIKPLFARGKTPDKHQYHVTTKTVHRLPPPSCEEFLMDHEGVVLSLDVNQGLINELHLKRSDHCTPHPDKLDSRAILLPDMSTVPGKAVMIEVKPKWLAQSASAARDAYRCRTCAIHASRVAHKETTEPYICPLQLIRPNKNQIEKYVNEKIQELDNGRELLAAGHVPTIQTRLVDYLTHGPGHKLLKHLKALQIALDPIGITKLSPDEHSDEVDRRLRLAMSLRDCSFFIRVPYTDWTVPIEAKLGDLDFKSDQKMEDWNKKEFQLNLGGWYVNVKSAPDYGCLIAEGWKKYAPAYF